MEKQQKLEIVKSALAREVFASWTQFVNRLCVLGVKSVKNDSKSPLSLEIRQLWENRNIKPIVQKSEPKTEPKNIGSIPSGMVKNIFVSMIAYDLQGTLNDNLKKQLDFYSKHMSNELKELLVKEAMEK